MKPLFRILLFVCIFACSISAVFAEQPPIMWTKSVKVVQEGSNEESPAYILTGHGDYFIPLRAVAEKLGYTVIWNQSTRSAEVIIGDQSTTVKPDIDIYQYNDMEPVSLGIAPVLIDNKLYVISEYFVEVLQLSIEREAETDVLWIRR